MAIENKGAIRYYGALFKASKGTIPKAAAKAVADTQKFAELTLKANTPVDTGKLRQGWQLMQTKKGLAITNFTPYALYVEMGTRRMRPRNMLKNSLPIIENYFEDRLKANLGKSLAASVAKSTEVSYESLRNESNFRNGLR